MVGVALFGDDLHPATFLAEQALEQVRRADHAPVRDREAPVRDAGLEVVGEAPRSRAERGKHSSRFERLA